LASGVFGTWAGEYVTARFSPKEVADALSTDPPIRAIVVPERDQGLQGELWIYPGVLSENAAGLAAASTAAENDTDLHNKLYQNGFLDVELTLATLLLEGRRNVPVRVINIRAEILDRQPLPQGYSLLGPGPQGTGESILIGFDLDSSNLDARAVEELRSPYDKDSMKGSFFSSHNTELILGEQEVYRIVSRSFRSDVKWQLIAEVAVAGESAPTTVPITNGGKPFRTIALHSRKDSEVDQAQYSELYRYQGEPDIRFIRVSHLEI